MRENTALQQELPEHQGNGNQGNEQTDNKSKTSLFIVPEGFSLNEAIKSKRRYEDLRITDKTEIDPPVPVIMIGDSIISTEGNITAVSGASKSGKSAFCSWIIAGAICQGEPAEQLEGLNVGPNHDRKAVIHIDTEQARHKQKSNLLSILKRCGYDTCPDFFLSYNLRQLDLSEYKEATTDIVEQAGEKFGGVHLIVIDGIADYITDVNDALESNAIVRFFEQLSERFSTPVIVILHTNPGNDKERGHLGSQCQRKSESIITVRCENGVSYVDPKFLRMAGDQDVPRIQFSYNKEKGYHVGCGFRKKTEEEKTEEKIATAKELAETVFSPSVGLKYSDAINQIKTTSGKAETMAKEYFKLMKDHSFIKQDESKLWLINQTAYHSLA